MDTRIYVMTHKEYDEPREECYKSLAVGKSLNPQLPYSGDDTGDNISEKNRNYCELTGVYWVWKNVACDIVGICHYRRYFVRDCAVMTQEQIESTLADFDVIVSRSERTPYKSLREHYSDKHFVKDLDMCRSVLEEMHPDYLPEYDLCVNCNLFTLGNMIITRKNIFDEYCEWLFPILFEVEKRTDISGYDTFQARIYGYLSERLLRVWILHQPLKVKEEETRLTDQHELDEKAGAAGIVRRYTEMLLKDLITLYKAGNYFDMEPIKPPCTDFGKKRPVWLCMWKEAGEIQTAVRGRLEKIESNILTDEMELINITFENVEKYVKFPTWIADKFNRGIIKPAQLADIVQMYVMYAYGGVWLGEGYVCTGAVNADFKAGGVQERFVLNALYLYWYQKDELISTDLPEIITAIARDNIDGLR